MFELNLVDLGSIFLTSDAITVNKWTIWDVGDWFRSLRAVAEL
jgi:hypothetical protein